MAASSSSIERWQTGCDEDDTSLATALMAVSKRWRVDGLIVYTVFKALPNNDFSCRRLDSRRSGLPSRVCELVGAFIKPPLLALRHHELAARLLPHPARDARRAGGHRARELSHAARTRARGRVAAGRHRVARRGL